MKTKAALLWISTTCVFLMTSGEIMLCAQVPGVRIDFDTSVPMKDGTRLATTVFRPDKPGRFAVLLERTPYQPDWFIDDQMFIASQGYAVAVQWVRGRYDSEGEFFPFVHEEQDGDAAIAWAASQTWSNGEVCMMGESYMAATQWFAALAGNPHLRCLIPGYGASDYYKHWVYGGGVLQLSFDASWAAFELQGRFDQLVKSYRISWENALMHLPLSNLPESIGWRRRRVWDEWLRHPTYDTYWKALSIEGKYNRITTPALLFSGWYDTFLEGTLTNFVGLKQKARSHRARTDTSLIVGPWFHSGDGMKAGEIDFGPQARLDWRTEALHWLNRQLKNEPTDGQSAPVRIFVMGENRWRNENEWPLARTRYTSYYFHSSSGANRGAGDGKLSTQSPVKETPDRFDYNPELPVATLGGNACCWMPNAPEGAYDQRKNEDRSDVLVYTSEILQRPLEITGPIEVELYAATSARDTDWTAKLTDVFPDGRSMNVSEGILRASFRNSFEYPATNAGGSYMYRVVMHATGNLFREGHRIRVDISSSDFPHYARNLNTGEPFGTAQRAVIAHQTIYHDNRHPSAIILPVIPR